MNPPNIPHNMNMEQQLKRINANKNCAKDIIAPKMGKQEALKT
jgi:hypothetical protein